MYCREETEYRVSAARSYLVPTWAKLPSLSWCLRTVLNADCECTSMKYGCVCFHFNAFLSKGSLVGSDKGVSAFSACLYSSLPNCHFSLARTRGIGLLHAIVTNMPSILCTRSLNRYRRSLGHRTNHLLALPEAWQFISGDKVTLDLVFGDDGHSDTSSRRSVTRHGQCKCYV